VTDCDYHHIPVNHGVQDLCDICDIFLIHGVSKIIGFKVTVKNVGDVFLRHSVYLLLSVLDVLFSSL